MKKLIITLLVILCSHVLLAQTDGCLIVKEYSQDGWQVLHGTTYVDMDDDGVWDFKYFKETSSSLMSAPWLFAREWACFHKIDIPGFEYNYPEGFNTFTVKTCMK